MIERINRTASGKTLPIYLVPVVCAGAVILASAANATDPEVIYSEVSGDPTALVPGLGGAEFDSFDRPYRSPNGMYWIISASSDLATSEDEVIIVGQAIAGNLVVREGTSAEWTVGENVGFIDTRLGINNLGQYAFATNTDGPSDADEYIVLWDGNGFVAAAQEGDAVPGFPNDFYGFSLDSAQITLDGDAGFRAPSTTGELPSDQDDFVIVGDTIIAQTGVTIPGNQAGGAMEAWDTFDSNDFYASATGGSTLIRGDLTGDVGGDDVIVVDGDVVLQEASVIDGSGFVSPVDGFTEALMMSNGDWFARGDNEDDQDWVVRNGDVVAASGEPIVPGSDELFSDAIFSSTFFAMYGNNNGDYIVAGTTDAADPDFDAVLVLNGSEVVARQGDPVVFPSNGGQPAFIDIFNNDDGFLTDDLMLYFTAILRDENGTQIGQAFLRKDLSGDGCPADFDGDGDVDVDDLLTLLANWGDAEPEAGDVDGDGDVDVDDLLALLSDWGACP